MFESNIDAILEEYTHLLDDDYSSIVFSQSTLRLYQVFFQRFEDYMDSKPYSRNLVFIFLDPEWYEIRVDCLLPLIKSAETDFKNSRFDYDSVLDSMDLNRRPSDSELFREIAKLYLKS